MKNNLKTKSTKVPFVRQPRGTLVDSGFTVLETIVAITLLSVAISGAFAAVRTGIYSASIAKEETRAYFLADEAVEMIRNKRDSNFLDRVVNGASTNWLAGIASSASDPCFTGKTCMADAFSNTLSNSNSSGSCPTSGNVWGSCPNLRQDPNTFLYGYNTSWPQTIYKREIQVETISANEVSVTVQVSWNHAGNPRSFKIKTTMDNWL